MKTPLRRKTGKMASAAGTTTAAMALVVILVGMASANKKEKVVLPDYVWKAKTVLVVILPDAGEPTDDPFANRRAQEEVEKAFMKWGRFQLTLDAELADLVVGVRKGTGRIANPTVNGGPVDSRPGTVEATDDAIRVGVTEGAPSRRDAAGRSTRNEWNERVHDRQAAHRGRSGRAGRYVQGVSGKSTVRRRCCSGVELRREEWIESTRSEGGSGVSEGSRGVREGCRTETATAATTGQNSLKRSALMSSPLTVYGALVRERHLTERPLDILTSPM